MATEELYDLSPLQAWVRENKPSLAYACEDLGYWRRNNGRRVPDISRVLRDLGVKNEGNGRGFRRRTSYEKAARLARALGAEPHEIGL